MRGKLVAINHEQLFFSRHRKRPKGCVARSICFLLEICAGLAHASMSPSTEWERFNIRKEDMMTKKLPKLVLLDRDGVINEEHPGYVKSLEEFKWVPGAVEGIKILSDAGIKLAIITNQGCIGRGIISADQLEEIHQHLLDRLKENGINLHKIFVCPDHPNHPTHRRKPSPGMLLESMEELGIAPEDTLMIGDDIRDLKAAYAAGCARHLVLTGHGPKTIAHEDFPKTTPVTVHNNLKEAAQFIINK